MAEIKLEAGLGERAWRILCGALLAMIVISLPIREGIDVSGLFRADDPKARAMFLTPTDILVAITALIFLVNVAFSRRLDALTAMPIPALLLTLWLGISLAPFLKGPTFAARGLTVDSALGLKEALQAFEYLVVVAMIFTLGTRHTIVLRVATGALFAVTTLILGFALYQYIQPDVSAMQVSGGLGNRNVLGAFLCIALPLLAGIGLRTSWILSAWSAILALAGLLVLLAGGLYLALCIGLLAVFFIYRSWLFPAMGLLMLMLLLFVAPALPMTNGKLRHNERYLAESVTLYRNTDAAGSFAAKLGAFNPPAPQTLEELAEQTEQKLAVLRELRREKAPIAPERIPVIAPADLSWPWQQRYTNWQAALNIMSEFPLTGIGAGGYRHVTEFYAPMPKYPRDLMEDDGHSVYFILGATAGAPALIFLLWLLATRLRLAYDAATLDETSDGLWQGLALGCLGALAAVAVGGFFNDLLIRTVGPMLGILLGLTAAAHARIFLPQCDAAPPARERNIAPVTPPQFGAVKPKESVSSPEVAPEPEMKK